MYEQGKNTWLNGHFVENVIRKIAVRLEFVIPIVVQLVLVLVCTIIRLLCSDD